MEHSNKVVIDGLSFIKSGRKYYYNAHTRQYLHRYLWEKENGKIPNGYEIHHKDHNTENNSLKNLELIKKGDHQKYHGSILSEEEREWKRNNLKENALPEAIRWHKSEEGKEWHKEHYENVKENLHTKSEFKCDSCGGVFISVINGKNRFCSNKCKSAWRRKSGVDNEIRKCIWCKNDFTVNKYSKAVYCSKKCSKTHYHSKLKSKDSPNLQE